MNRKIWKALGIAVCMLALAAPRAMAETHVHTVTADTNFAEVVKTINASKDEGEHVIELYDDITLTGNYTLTNGKTTTIKGKEGEDRKISINGSNDPNAGITVTGEETVLNLGVNGYDKKLTIEGDTGVAFITVSGGATANMYENVTLQNRQSTGNACVVIMNPNSVFNMHGGEIENCSRAVIADSGATFYMQSGEIKNCKVNGDGVISVNDGSKFIMEGGTISGCEAGAGGGLYAKNQSTITIEGGTISGCKALSLDKGNGGGLYVEDSTLTIERGTISGCTARNNGGGLYVDGSTITINNGTISECTAEMEEGGGLYADGSTITINKGTISECTAEMEEGGGLYATNQSTITINNGTISGCKTLAYKDGGGLYADNSAINISDGTISGCDGRWGGGLYAENSSTITITDSTISGCKAGAGGGLFVIGSTLNIEDDIISECTASDTGKGGGLYAENSTLTISGGTIKGNKAAYGGGVALVKSKVEEPITNWTVVDNEAYKTDTGSGYIGGGIYLESGWMDVSNGSNKIYNNTADGHGADICLTDDTSSIKLPNAANMGATYLDSGIYIDGWYNDDNPRYTPSESGVPVKVDGAEPLKGALSLVASYKAVPVRTVKIDTNGGVGGSGSQTVQKGTTVILEAPTKEGHLFKGWEDKEKGKSYPAGEDGKVKITVTSDMTLTAVWEARSFTVTYVLLNGKTRAETADYGQNVTLVEEPRTGYTFVGWKDGEKVYHAGETITVTGDMTLTAEWKKLPSAENLPKTGDESHVLLWGAVLAVSAAACFMLRRRK